MTPDEELELRALVGIAWERRGQSDYRAALEAIVDWHDRRHIRRFERKQRNLAALVLLLRWAENARRKQLARFEAINATVQVANIKPRESIAANDGFSHFARSNCRNNSLLPT